MVYPRSLHHPLVAPDLGSYKCCCPSSATECGFGELWPPPAPPFAWSSPQPPKLQRPLAPKSWMVHRVVVVRRSQWARSPQNGIKSVEWHCAAGHARFCNGRSIDAVGDFAVHHSFQMGAAHVMVAGVLEGGVLLPSKLMKAAALVWGVCVAKLV